MGTRAVISKRSRLVSRSLWLLIAVWFAASPLCATDHFNLESGIPIAVEDIEPVERGSFEFQAFGKFVRVRGKRSSGQTEPRVAAGILENTQLEIATPLLLGSGAANGNGDVELTLLRKLRDATPNERWPGFAVEADVTLPSGFERAGSKNRIDAGFTALLKKELHGHNLHLNAGVDWTRDESREESPRRMAWSVVAGHHAMLTPKVVVVSDLVWRQADETRTRDVVVVESGVRSQLTRKLIGAVGIGVGLNRGSETPAFTFTFGFQLGLR